MDRKELQPLKRTEPAALPEKVLQFGGGNFLRAFTDWMIDIFNKETDFAGSVVIVKPTERGIIRRSMIRMDYFMWCWMESWTGSSSRAFILWRVSAVRFILIGIGKAFLHLRTSTPCGL